VVVFNPPGSWTDNTTPFIKRVIGEPGDTVEIGDDGLVYVNGVQLQEAYTYANDRGIHEPTTSSGRVKWLVPAGELFVMGDHRQASADSRLFGPIHESDVIGRAFLRYWPVSAFGLLPSPSYPDAVPATP
jgi:signal peptidase I